MTTDVNKKIDTSCRGFFIDTKRFDFNGYDLVFVEKNIHNYYPIKMRPHVTKSRELMQVISNLQNIRHTYQAQLRTQETNDNQRRFNNREKEAIPPRYIVRESMRGTFLVDDNIYTLEVALVPLNKQDGFRVRNETAESAEIPSSKTKEHYERAVKMLFPDAGVEERLASVTNSLYELLFNDTKTTRSKVSISNEEKSVSVIMQHTESSSHVFSFKLKIAPRKTIKNEDNS